jgi:hypothetical protein
MTATFQPSIGHTSCCHGGVAISYVLPIRLRAAAGDELVQYVCATSAHAEVIVVDGSPAAVFAAHANRWRPPIVHLAPDADLRSCANGKVAGVLTGLRRASHEHVVIADEDVRYDVPALDAVAAALARSDVVRPQNYFDPLPWHACIDTARTLLNRVSGGDWPGTLGVNRSMLLAAGGYDGDVLFENLELVRTVRAAGGTEAVRLDLYVRRLPPSTAHFCAQRIRQAYDEFASPRRLAVWLALLPTAIALSAAGEWRVMGGALLASIVAAEIGRWRAGGRRVFPIAASIAAPIWLAERAVCAWLALGAHLILGGIPYRGRIVSHAATPLRRLETRIRGA